MKLCTRPELLERWRRIEEEADLDDDRLEPSKRHSLHKSKERWFEDTFNLLISLPKDNHLWCGSCDLMGPLLETFDNYFSDQHSESPLRRLWRRISGETRQCIQCISQYHQAQEMYSTEYEMSTIGPLLNVLQRLDEERVTQHLREMNTTLARKDRDPSRDNAEVVDVMYESLEALQDGEHEKQRRHVLYFLLHQVTVSSDFSVLTRQRACQISLLVVHRGYTMNPPCPPFECAHMWGPSLVSSMKDSSLHNSLRQPAFDLIQTIIVSDAAAPLSSEKNLSFQLNDEDEKGLPFSLDSEEKDTSPWQIIINVRQFCKCILEQVSVTRGLTCGLNFLCWDRSSLSSVLFGVKHAAKLYERAGDFHSLHLKGLDKQRVADGDLEVMSLI